MIEIRELPYQTCRPSVRKAVFRCYCGCETTTSRDSVKHGRTSSCGCYQRRRVSEASTKHGHNKGGKPSRELSSYRSMMTRCYSQNNHKYPSYGGRGIKVCERWRGSFESFLFDMGPRPSNTS